MYVWSKALAIALVAALVGFGATAIQAKDHNHKDQSCQKPEGCPAPVIQQPTVESSCCPIPEVPTRCAPPPQPGCCGVVDNSKDKDYDDAHKAALKAHHEAQEACQKRQKAIARAQHEISEKVAKEQRRIDKANDHFNHEVSELQAANAKYDSLFPSEAVAEAPVTQPELLPEPEVIRSKPEPEPIQVQPAEPQVEEQVAVLEVPTAPSPEPAPPETPKALPKTASPLSLIGLIGLAASMSGYATRLFRR